MNLDLTFIVIILSAAVLLQLVATGLWIRLINKYDLKWPWLLLVGGSFVLAILAGIILYITYPWMTFQLNDEISALLLFTIGMIAVVNGYWIAPNLIIKNMALEKVQRDRDLYKRIFEGIPNPVVAKDAALKYQAVNPAFARFLGKEQEFVQGETDAAFFPRSQSHQFNQADQKVILSGQPTSSETEVLGAEGRRWLQFDRVPLGKDEEEPQGILVYAKDLTDQKKNEFTRKQAFEDLQSLHEATLNLLTQLEIVQLQNKILKEAYSLTGIPNGCFAIPEAETGLLSIKTGSGALKGATGLQFGLEEDVAGKVWQSSQPLEINDYPNWPGRSPQLRSFKLGAVMGVPIRIGAEVVAVVLLAQNEDNPTFAEGLLSQAQALGKISAKLIQNARAMAATRQFSEEQVKQLKLLRHQARFEHLLAAVASHFINLPPDKISQGVRQALQAIGKLIQVDRSYLYLYPELNFPGDHIITWEVEGAGSFKETLESFQPSRYPWWMGKLTRSETVHVQDPETLPPEASALSEFLQDQGIISFTTVPLIAERAVVGFLGFDSLEAPVEHSPEAINLLEAAGETLINALTRAREAQGQVVQTEALAKRVTLLEQRNREHALITEMGELLAASRTADESYPIVARYTQRLIPVGSGTLYTLDNPEDPAQASASWGEKPSDVAELALNECWALRRGRAHLVTDQESGPNCHHLSTPNPESYLCVPLIAQGEAGGCSTSVSPLRI